MPRFFLHISNDQLIEDPDGADFANLEAALAEATASAREIMADGLKSGRSLELDRQIVVADEDGNIVGRISFAEALPKA